MEFPLFIAVLTGDFLLLLGIIISIFFPKFRVWPPPRKGSWQQWVSWSLFLVDMLGVLLLSILDFESIWRGHWFRFVLGGLAVVIGLCIDIWGTRTLSAQQSLGSEGKLVTSGPYRFTRNPQYVGFILFYIGVIIIAYSFMALVAGTLLIFIFLLLPFSEEPWLKQQLDRSMKNTPRKCHDSLVIAHSKQPTLTDRTIAIQSVFSKKAFFQHVFANMSNILRL